MSQPIEPLPPSIAEYIGNFDLTAITRYRDGRVASHGTRPVLMRPGGAARPTLTSCSRR
jgi:hypothetical protein